MQRLTSQLSAVVEVGMAMNAEREPARLVKLFFAAACEVLDSNVTVLGLLDEREGTLAHVLTRGVDAVRSSGGRRGTAQRAARIADRGAQDHPRPSMGRLPETAEGLPEGHPDGRQPARPLGRHARSGSTAGCILPTGRMGNRFPKRTRALHASWRPNSRCATSMPCCTTRSSATRPSCSWRSPSAAAPRPNCSAFDSRWTTPSTWS